MRLERNERSLNEKKVRENLKKSINRSPIRNDSYRIHLLTFYSYLFLSTLLRLSKNRIKMRKF